MMNALKDGLRMFYRRFEPYHKYKGTPDEICRQIVDSCWNGHFFQTSLGHFSQFYVRDFAFSLKGLLKLGYSNRVKSSLTYALDIFNRDGRITTTITPDGKSVDYFSYTPESVALIVYCLRELGDKSLITKYQNLIITEVRKAFDFAFDKELSLLRKDLQFSSMKDNSIRQSSCYNNCMLAMLSDNLNILDLKNPFKNFDIKANIKKHFWNGKYFRDDLSGKNYVAGDANTFPFWCRVFDDRKMFISCFNAIKSEGLDKPWPLKYTKLRTPQMFPQNILAPNYEGNTIWMHLGGCFLSVVQKYDQKAFKQYLDAYSSIINKYKNYLELFNPDGSIYKSLFYKSDEGMLWAAQYLEFRQSR